VAAGQAPFAARAGASPLPAGAAGNRTPWIIAGILTIVTIAAIAYSARGKGAPEGTDMGNAGNATPAAAGGTGGTLGPAPDISQMTPREQFARLEARVTAAAEKGDSATVINFTPMALGAYTNLPPGDRDIDARYHAAMLQAQVGMFPGALALADTINAESKNNLMATYIRIMVAEFQGDSAKAKAERAKFRDNFDAEMKTKRPEYVDHQPFLENYRKNAGAK
jgi:hypothetical protein